MQIGQTANRFSQYCCFSWNASRFGVIRVNVYLDADLEWRQMRWPLVAKTLRHLQSVHCMHPMEMLGDIAGFIALNWADKVPDQIWMIQCRNFRQRLLHIVLAEFP